MYGCTSEHMASLGLVTLVSLLSVAVGVHREGDIRLVGGRHDHDGTVVVYHNKKWGAICDDEWDLRDARVACQQLGFPGAKRAAKRSEFGRGRRRIWMSRVRCSGFEHQLRYCMFFGWGRIRRRCLGGWRSAGVVCLKGDGGQIKTTTRKPIKRTTPKATTTTTRTTTTKRPTTTRKPPTTPRTLWTIFGPTPFKQVKPEKSPEEMALDDAEHNNKMMSLLDGERDYSVQADAPSPSGLQLRIQGGRYFWEGRLEVNKGDGGGWGAICGEKWSIREAMVACRELNLDHGKQALQVNYFGGENLDKYYNEIRCNGREKKLDDCEKIETSHNVACSKPILVAGVVCSKFLPDLIPNLEVLQSSVLLQDRPLYYLQCALEENCLSSSAAVVRNTSKNWMSSSRRLLKFSTVVHNRGLADFRPYKAKGQWEWHQCHMHYHSMEVFAHYDIIDEHGNRLAEGSKASFCLEDSTCDPGVEPQYDCTGYGDQGLSVNCSDNYMNDIDCQWIDITDIPIGKYIFKMEINPTILVAELDYDNNVAICEIWYSGYNAKMYDCRYESLL
ncbi:hypothetical protein SNE40_007618 [Patella caerulea]|uniref:protein-lysine 6-oxidase n=1 Tax=Patella caerulea TaxID=87958 RepID=A0AAN8PV96_PATCE